MPAWLDYLVGEIAGNKVPCMLVTVAETKGSVPRDPGTRMIVSADTLFGTIGGGALEFEAIAEARARLKETHDSGVVTYPLGPELGQCCGGSVIVLFEDMGRGDLAYLERLQAMSANGTVARASAYVAGQPPERIIAEPSRDGGGEIGEFARQALANGAPRIVEEKSRIIYAEPVRESRPALWLFGAGHVGKAVADACAALPFKITWVDARADMFPDPLPRGVVRFDTARPELAVKEAPRGAHFLVMTHSHPLDQKICEAVLLRRDAAYLGLIGSKTKKAQFLKRLKAKGLNEEQLSTLICPIGLPGIAGKAPAVIAASVAADLLMRVTSP